MAATIEPADRPESWPLLSRTILGRGRVENFVEDEIQGPDGSHFTRQWASHPGAVGVIALRDDNRVAVVQQYRHPVGMRLVEPPAGLLDVKGEQPVDAARRELAEETQLAADRWQVLVDASTSPGGLQENLRVFLARDLRPAPRPDGFVVEDEEADMAVGWLPLAELVEGVFAGRLQSPTMVIGILALQTALSTGRLDHLRAADAPWPVRTQWAARTAEVEKLV